MWIGHWHLGEVSFGNLDRGCSIGELNFKSLFLIAIHISGNRRKNGQYQVGMGRTYLPLGPSLLYFLRTTPYLTKMQQN